MRCPLVEEVEVSLTLKTNNLDIDNGALHLQCQCFLPLFDLPVAGPLILQVKIVIHGRFAHLVRDLVSHNEWKLAFIVIIEDHRQLEIYLPPHGVAPLLDGRGLFVRIVI